jgi:hypothetical protein
MRIIDVRPFAHGWTVQSDEIDNELIFSSGRAAEQAALRLADRLAKAGAPSEIRIHLRDGTLGGRFFSPALDPIGGHPSATPRAPSRAVEPA